MKHFLLPLTEPLGAIWAIMLAGLIVLAYKRNWLGTAVVALPLALFFLIGSTTIPEMIVAAAERPYARQPSAGSNAFDCIIVLGGGHSVSRYDPHGFTSSEAADRFIAAAGLVRKGVAPVLVLGGGHEGPDNPGVPESVVVQRWLESTGLAPNTLTNLGVCTNTRDEAVAAKALLASRGWTNALLVTSALHMRRSEALFRKHGIPVTPLACDFQCYGVSRELRFSIFPRQRRLELLSLYLHERIGWVMYRLLGWA